METFDLNSMYRICLAMLENTFLDYATDDQETKQLAIDYIFDDNSRIEMNGIEIKNFFSFDNCCYILTKYHKLGKSRYKNPLNVPKFDPQSIRERILELEKNETRSEQKQFVQICLIELKEIENA